MLARFEACLLGGMLALIAACGMPPPATTVAPTGTPPASRPSAPPAPTSPRPSTSEARPRILIDDLPMVELDPATLTALCDPEPIQLDPDAGETTVLCGDAILLGLRTVTAAAAGPVTRIYLRRPACATTPCSEDELSTALVVAAALTGTFAVRIDGRLDSVAAPERLFIDPWPPARTRPEPSVVRETFANAPAEVAARKPYPYCGRAVYDEPTDVITCFLDRVLLGLPVEAVQVSFGTEGGEVSDILRFDGKGAITRYRFVEGRWIGQRGGLVLGAPNGSWSFDPWGDAVALS